MAGSNNTAIKVILVMGVLAFVGLFAVSLGLRRSVKPDERERVRAMLSASPVNGDSAMAHVVALTSHGSRGAGRSGLVAARDYLATQARAAGLRVSEVAGAGTARHVVAALPGPKSGSVLVAARYDAWGGGGADYVGANDGAASAGLVLALAQAFGEGYFGRTLTFAWLDGTGGESEGTTRALGEVLEHAGRDAAGPVGVAFFVDGVGDCYLRLAGDPAAPAWLSSMVREVAITQGTAEHVGPAVGEAPATAQAFASRGIPGIVLADRLMGGSMLEHSRLWHSNEDTLARVCVGSLKAVGDLLYHAVAASDARLDTLGSVGS